MHLHLATFQPTIPSSTSGFMVRSNETPPHVVLGWVVPVRTVACAGIDAGLQGIDEDAGQTRSLIADTTEDLKDDVGGPGDVGEVQSEEGEGKERGEDGV